MIVRQIRDLKSEEMSFAHGLEYLILLISVLFNVIIHTILIKIPESYYTSEQTNKSEIHRDKHNTKHSKNNFINMLCWKIY